MKFSSIATYKFFKSKESCSSLSDKSDNEVAISVNIINPFECKIIHSAQQNEFIKNTINFREEALKELDDGDFEAGFKFENRNHDFCVTGNIKVFFVCARHAGLISKDTASNLVQKLDQLALSSSLTNEQIAKLNLYEIDYEKAEKALPPYASAAYPRPLN